MEKVAMCFSKNCTDFVAHNVKRVEKEVPRKTTFCPDCGHALVWMNAPTKSIFRAEAPKVKERLERKMA